jgi:hypothetical protein
MDAGRSLRQRKQTVASMLYLLCVLVAVGCRRPDSGLTGKWTYQPPDVGSVSGFNSNKQAAIRSGQKMMANWSLDLRPDHTFTLTVLQPIEGTWTMDGSTVTLNAQRILAGVMGPEKEWKQTLTVTLSGDGNELRMDRNNPLLPMAFVFRK